jgi:hypothetical protein
MHVGRRAARIDDEQRAEAGIPSQPSANSRAPSITAAGVGISTWSSSACARSIPFACTMRSMNTRRIAARAGSTSRHVELGHHVGAHA